MSIELKQLGHYIDRKLKIGFEGDEHQYDLIGLSLCTDGVLLMSPFNDAGSSSLDKCKPIMFPLSALTEAVLEGGKIPIVELAKMAGFKPTRKIVIGIEGEFCFVNIDKERYGIQDRFSYFTKTMVFRTVLNGYGCFNQLQLFDQLYEWHFWLFRQDLFETGELIDKRTPL